LPGSRGGPSDVKIRHRLLRSRGAQPEAPGRTKDETPEAAACLARKASALEGAGDPTAPPYPLLSPVTAFFQTLENFKTARVAHSTKRAAPTKPSRASPGQRAPSQTPARAAKPPEPSRPPPPTPASAGQQHRPSPGCPDGSASPPTTPWQRSLWATFAPSPRIAGRLKHPPHGWRWNTRLVAMAVAMALGCQMAARTQPGLLQVLRCFGTLNFASLAGQRRELVTHPRAAPGS
jgi:hypothetical protein